MRAIGPRFEFGTELDADEITVPQFKRLHDVAIWRSSTDDVARFDQCLTEVVIELISMAVAFTDQILLVKAFDDRPVFQAAILQQKNNIPRIMIKAADKTPLPTPHASTDLRPAVPTKHENIVVIRILSIRNDKSKRR